MNCYFDVFSIMIYLTTIFNTFNKLLNRKTKKTRKNKLIGNDKEINLIDLDKIICSHLQYRSLMMILLPKLNYLVTVNIKIIVNIINYLLNCKFSQIDNNLHNIKY